MTNRNQTAMLRGFNAWKTWSTRKITFCISKILKWKAFSPLKLPASHTTPTATNRGNRGPPSVIGYKQTWSPPPPDSSSGVPTLPSSGQDGKDGFELEVNCELIWLQDRW